MSKDISEIDLWEQIVYDVNGTCESLESHLETANALHLHDHMPFLNYLDDQIFRCTCCSWWCPVSEMSEQSEEPICTDCEE